MQELDLVGNKFWYNENREFHRIDAPAIEFVNGAKYWYFNGMIHRVNGPAIMTKSGTKYWYINSQKLTIPQYYNYLCKNQE